MRRAPLAVVFVMVTMLVLVASLPASAHTASRSSVAADPWPPTSEALISAAPAPGIPWTALTMLVAAAGLAAISGRRRALALTLVLVVGLLTFETGLHSTHHLNKPADARQCTVAWISAQLSADLVDVTIDAPPAPALQANATALAVSVFAERAVAPDAGRAPPVLSV